MIKGDLTKIRSDSITRKLHAQGPQHSSRHSPAIPSTAMRALELDERLAEARVTLGWLSWGYDLGWSNAERHSASLGLLTSCSVDISAHFHRTTERDNRLGLRHVYCSAPANAASRKRASILNSAAVSRPSNWPLGSLAVSLRVSILDNPSRNA